MSDSPERTYGGWILGNELGKGAFGTTYEAHRELSLLGRKFKQHSAVKVIREHLLGEQQALEEFAREVSLLSRVNSPFIVSFIDAGVEGDEIWFAQELINGLNLRKFMHGQALSESVWEDLATHMLLALKATHAANISHLDIKPENIMFAQGSDSFRLIDFGISKTQSAKGIDAASAGTMIYMPAEQFAGTPQKQSDIWALGMTLYHAATGVHPVISKHPDFVDLGPFEQYEAAMLFAVNPEIDWSLVSNEGHRALLEKMIVQSIDKRSTPTVLLQELRDLQGFRDPVITLGGSGKTSEAPSYWAAIDGLDEFDKWQLIRKTLPDLLKKKGTKIATITVDVQSSEMKDIDIRLELFSGGTILKLTAPEPRNAGLHKALTLGWQAAQLPSEIFLDLPGNSSYDTISEHVADLLEIAFSLSATQIRIF